MKKPIHYKPAGKTPRCFPYVSSSYDEKVAILNDKPRLTTDIAKTTCIGCCRHIHYVTARKLDKLGA